MSRESPLTGLGELYLHVCVTPFLLEVPRVLGFLHSVGVRFLLWILLRRTVHGVQSLRQVIFKKDTFLSVEVQVVTWGSPKPASIVMRSRDNCLYERRASAISGALARIENIDPGSRSANRRIVLELSFLCASLMQGGADKVQTPS